MSALDYSKFDELDFSSDEDDCHPNIEINTWRRLKARMREDKGIVKKEPILIDKWNTTAVNNKKTKYDLAGSSNDDTHKNDENNSANDNNSTNNENSNNNSSNNDTGNTNTNTSDEKSNDTIETDSKTNGAANNATQMRKDDTSTNGTKSNANEATTSAAVTNTSNTKTNTNKKSKKDSKDNSGSLFEARSDPKHFLDEYLPKIKKFSKMKSDERADEFLKTNFEMVHEATEGYIITFAVDRAVEGASTKQLKKYAKRCLTIHNLIQSCQSANVAPKVGVPLFYRKMESPQLKAMYAVELEKQVGELLGRIEVRRKERLAEAEAAYARGELDDEVEYVEEKAPLGPGGLDPTEVLNSLPSRMQQAFVSRDVGELKKVLSEMPVEEAQRHMQRCIDSGLWVDNSDENENENENETQNDTNQTDTGNANETEPAQDQ